MRETVGEFRTKWRTHLLWGVFWSFLLVPLVATFVYISIHEGDNSRPHLAELRKIADELPLYPGAQKVNDRAMLKHNIALLTVFYRSNASFSDVQSFYQRELPSRGWSVPPGPSHHFIDFNSHSGDYRRGDYFVGLEPDASSGNFSIAFMWEPQ
jgi:hypothetical protein